MSSSCAYLAAEVSTPFSLVSHVNWVLDSVLPHMWDCPFMGFIYCLPLIALSKWIIFWLRKPLVGSVPDRFLQSPVSPLKTDPEKVSSYEKMCLSWERKINTLPRETNNFILFSFGVNFMHVLMIYSVCSTNLGWICFSAVQLQVLHTLFVYGVTGVLFIKKLIVVTCVL